jgi:hypothetical protein
MGATPTDVSGAALKKLGKDAKDWQAKFVKSAASAAPLQADTSMSTDTSIFQQAVQLYGSAAKLFGIAATSDASTRKDILSEASDTSLEANALWQTGLTLLTEKRSAAGLGPPSLGMPSTPAAGAAPQPTPSPSTPSGSSKKGGGSKNGGGSKKGGGNGSKSK